MVTDTWALVIGWVRTLLACAALEAAVAALVELVPEAPLRVRAPAMADTWAALWHWEHMLTSRPTSTARATKANRPTRQMVTCGRTVPRRGARRGRRCMGVSSRLAGRSVGFAEHDGL